jgi:hypothetical protein
MNPGSCVYVALAQEYVVAILEEPDLPSEGEHHGGHRRHFLIELKHFDLIFGSVIYSEVPTIGAAPNVFPSDPIAENVLLASEGDSVRVVYDFLLYLWHQFNVLWKSRLPSIIAIGHHLSDLFMLPNKLHHLVDLRRERLYAFLDLIELGLMVPVLVLNKRNLALHDLNERLSALLDGENLLIDAILGLIKVLSETSYLLEYSRYSLNESIITIGVSRWPRYDLSNVGSLDLFPPRLWTVTLDIFRLHALFRSLLGPPPSRLIKILQRDLWPRKLLYLVYHLLPPIRHPTGHL